MRSFARSWVLVLIAALLVCLVPAAVAGAAETPEIEKFFAEYFKGHPHRLAIYKGVEKTITVNGLKGLNVYLPWARTFEAVIEFKLDYSAN